MRNLYCVLVALAFHLNLPAQVPIFSSYPAASAVIFLDFDGHTVEGTSWNSTGPILCGPSGLSNTRITEIFNRVAEDYRPFNINVTTDSTKFLAAPLAKRMRVILTVTSSWYGPSGGVAFVGSFSWGDDTPCFVFSALLGNRMKDISEATSHEVGHTLGLYHQSKYDAVTCAKISDYDPGQGSGEIGWAPIMGVGYYKNFTLWNNGANSFGCTSMQSDLDIITADANGFGYRTDDHGSSFDSATLPMFSNQQFIATGVVERNTDHDIFRFIMPGNGRFQLNAIPYNVGTGNAGSDLDMQVTLYDQHENVLSIYNPGALLNSVADTMLNSGTYYLRVEGKGNLYAPSYASLGSYSLQGSIDIGAEPLPLRQLELRGVQNGERHELSWLINADEKITEQVLEFSTDGKNFTVLDTAGTQLRAYSYIPATPAALQYRLKVVFDDGHRYYSNTVSIRDKNQLLRPKLVSNLIQSNTVYVSSPGLYAYSVIDLNGRILSRGQLTSGINNIEVYGMTTGMYLVRFTGNDQQWTDKLLRQ